MKTYLKPIVEILKYQEEDVIRTSGFGVADYNDCFEDENWG